MTTNKKLGCLYIDRKFFATEKEHIAFIRGAQHRGTLTGSRAFAVPAVTEMSDADYLLAVADFHALCDAHMIHPMEERAKHMYAEEKYDMSGQVQCVYVIPPNDMFATINLLVCRTQDAFTEWKLATEICRAVSELVPYALTVKTARVDFFEKIRAIVRKDNRK